MDAAQLEEANRLRVEMGMKPLPVPGQEPVARDSDEEEEDPNATLDGRHAQAYDNFKKIQEAEQAKRRREERAEAVKRAREKAQRTALLEGSTLTEEGGKGDEDEDDARAWLKGQKKRQRKIAKEQEEADKKQKEEEERRRQQQQSADDLAGLKVGHDMSALLGGGDDADAAAAAAAAGDGDLHQILTLKDSTVLENEDEGDELENIGLREHERLQERLDLKKKRPVYDPLGGGDDQIGGGSGILGHYDEEIYGKKRKAFTLDPNAILGLSADGDDKDSNGPLGTKILGTAAGSTRQKITDSIGIDDVIGGGPSSDYLDVSEIKIKKPKKKSKAKKANRSTRQRQVEDEDDVLFRGEEETGAAAADDANDMDIDGGSEALLQQQRKKRKAAADAEDDLIQDEDDLHTALALQRRAALKKRKRMRPEDLAKQLRAASQEEDETPGQEAGNGGDGDDGNGEDVVMTTEDRVAGGGGGIVIDETAEFVSNIKRRDPEEDAPRPKKKPQVKQEEEEERVTAMNNDDSDDDSDSDVAMKDGDREGQGDGEGGLDTNNLPTTGLEEEKMVSKGLGAALSLLRDRGILSAPPPSADKKKQPPRKKGEKGVLDEEEDATGADKNAQFRKHQEFITEKRVRLARIEDEARRRREQDRASGSNSAASRLSTREREEHARKQNAQREFQTSRMLQDLFNEKYTPNFQLEYVDEHGRELNQKEAFRALSHGFHGKTSGRGKTDKMLKKIEAEKRHMAEGILDASQNVGMSSATAQQLKKRKEAGVRLD